MGDEDRPGERSVGRDPSEETTEADAVDAILDRLSAGESITFEECERVYYPVASDEYGSPDEWWAQRVEPALRDHPEAVPADENARLWRPRGGDSAGGGAGPLVDPSDENPLGESDGNAGEPDARTDLTVLPDTLLSGPNERNAVETVFADWGPGELRTTRELLRDSYRHAPVDYESEDAWWVEVLEPVLIEHPDIEPADSKSRRWRRTTEPEPTTDDAAVEHPALDPIPEHLLSTGTQREFVTDLLTNWAEGEVLTRRALKRDSEQSPEEFWDGVLEPVLESHPEIERADSNGRRWRRVESTGEDEPTWDEAVVAELPGGLVETPAERAVATGVVRYIPAEGVATTRELRRRVYPEYPADFEDDSRWWESLVEPILRGHPAVEPADSNGRRWRRVDDGDS